jgi:hypothetical protein
VATIFVATQPNHCTSHRLDILQLRMGVTKDVITPGDGRTFPKTGDQLTMHYQYVVGPNVACISCTATLMCAHVQCHAESFTILPGRGRWWSFNDALVSRTASFFVRRMNTTMVFTTTAGHWRRRAKNLTRVGIVVVPFRFKLESARSFGYVTNTHTSR